MSLRSVSPVRADRADVFAFGGIALALRSDSHRFSDLAARRYAAFATAETPAWFVSHRLVRTEEPSPRSLAVARDQAMQGRREGSRLRLTAPTFEIDLDTATRTAELRGPLATYPLDRLIRVLWYETRPQGLIVHGAALAEGSDGWLASGPSGSGKSTLATLLPEHALCDEFAGVDLARPHLARSAPELWALPFWRGRPGVAKLRGIYLLRHGAYNRRRELEPAEAFRRLRREIRWPTYDPAAVQRALDSLASLLERVSIRELTFRPTREVWDTIRRVSP